MGWLFSVRLGAPSRSCSFSFAVLMLMGVFSLFLVQDSRASTVCPGESSIQRCLSASNCTSGTLVSGVCPGGETCCLIGDVSGCEAVGGACQLESTCSTSSNTVQSGLCPGSSAIKCCVPTGGPTPKVRCPGESSATFCFPNGGNDCSNGVTVLSLCSGSQSCCFAGASASQCSAAGGSCTTEDACDASGGTSQPGLCPGSEQIKCCIPRVSTGQACKNEPGTCFSTASAAQCLTGTFVPGLCDGPADVQCCVSGDDTACINAGGSCQTIENCNVQGGESLSGLCPGSSNIKCCKGPTVPPTLNPNDPTQAWTSCFPLTADSLDYVSVNWGGRRSGGSRCHAGIDILTKSPGVVVAVDDGVVVSIYNFLQCSSGWAGPGQTVAVIVYHPNLGKTVNYGEVDFDHVTVKVGETITKGQRIGRAGYCGMLHFELYSGQVSANQRWFPPAGALSESPDKCAREYLSTKPAALDDPRPFVSQHNGRYCSMGGGIVVGPIATPPPPTPTPSDDASDAGQRCSSSFAVFLASTLTYWVLR